MRLPALILTVMAASLLIAPASTQDGVNQSTKKIKELQKERIAVLKEMADQTTELVIHGKASFEAALEARVLVFEAGLDSAEKESDRITLHKNIVDVLKQYENVADGRVKATGGPSGWLVGSWLALAAAALPTTGRCVDRVVLLGSGGAAVGRIH